jgi:hypothetical protein
MLICKTCGAEVGRVRDKRENLKWCNKCGANIYSQYELDDSGKPSVPGSADNMPSSQTPIIIGIIIALAAVLIAGGIAVFMIFG